MANSTDPAFTSLRNLSKEQGVYEQLRGAIISGEISAGQRLISAEIGEKLGVSSMPVRNALMRLEAEGLVTRFPHREFVVTIYSSRDVKELYTVRAALDSLAGRVAASKVTSEDLVSLKEILARSEKALEQGDMLSLRRINREFHAAICAIADNRHLQEIILGLQVKVPGYHEQYYAIPGLAERSVADHRRVLDALAEGRGDLVEEMLRRDMETTGDTLATIVESIERSKELPG